MKKALITGQDGSYLAEFLLAKGYEIYHLGALSHVRARVAALFPLRTLGLRRMGVSSLEALLIRSEPERYCFSF